MKTTSLGLLLLAALASPVAAEPYDATEAPRRSRGYVGVTTHGGFDRLFRVGLAVEGGWQVRDGVFVRGLVSGGASGAWRENGHYQQLRAGVEARTCAGRPESLCAFGGADLGYVRDALRSDAGMSAVAHGAQLVPRVGGELGERVRLRVALELPMTSQIGVDGAGSIGLALTAGVAVTY